MRSRSALPHSSSSLKPECHIGGVPSVSNYIGVLTSQTPEYTNSLVIGMAMGTHLYTQLSTYFPPPSLPI